MFGYRKSKINFITSNAIRPPRKAPTKTSPRERQLKRDRERESVVGFSANRPNKGNHVSCTLHASSLSWPKKKKKQVTNITRGEGICDHKWTTSDPIRILPPPVPYTPSPPCCHMNRKLKRKSLVCKYNGKGERRPRLSHFEPGPDLKLSNIVFGSFSFGTYLCKLIGIYEAEYSMWLTSVYIPVKEKECTLFNSMKHIDSCRV